LAALLLLQAKTFPERAFREERLDPAKLFEVYLEEALFLFEVVRPTIVPQARVLEIGGGLGIFHVLMREAGLDLVSIEPSGQGFSYFHDFGVSLIKALDGDPSRMVDARAEALPWPAESFDLVVSGNVMEHVADPEAAIREMYRVVRPGGALINLCPNYLFPYEPHYGVPIIPCAVRLSGRLLWRSFSADPLWQSLNGISAITVSRIARSLPGSELRFHDAIGRIVARLKRDAHFAKRHGWLSSVVLSRPVRALVNLLPARALSPMIFEIRKR
jgi:SAM-dependent methyltransferase